MINTKTTNNLKIITSTVILTTLMSGCINTNETQAIQTSSAESYATESTIEETEQSSINTEQSTTESYEHSIETIQYTCPVEYDVSLAQSFKEFLKNKYGKRFKDDITSLGFDNAFLDESLHEFISQNYGINDPSITIRNFHYFQFLNYRFSGAIYDDANEMMENVNEEKYVFLLARAALISENSIFIVDEIPSSYFENRFPYFMSRYGDASFRDECQSRIAHILTEVLDENNIEIDKLNSLNEYDYDLLLFWSFKYYNYNRNALMYSSGHENVLLNIKQIHDENTGRNFLELDDQQIRILNNTMDNYDGYDFSVDEPESREHFYQTYGIYPESLINNEKIYEENRP